MYIYDSNAYDFIKYRCLTLNVYAYLTSLMRATCPAQLIIVDLTILIIFDQ